MIGPASEDKVKRDRVVLEQRRSGMVRIVGEREMLRLRGVDDQDMMSVNDAPALGRIFFMAAGAFANFATALFLFFLAALIGLLLPVGGLSQVAAIPVGSLFAGTAVETGDAIEKINGERFADFTAFHQVLAAYEDERIEFSLLRPESGDAFSVTVTPNFAGRAGAVQILGLAEGSPAERAGLAAGDIVTQIHHLPISPEGDPAETLREATRRAEGKPLPLTILPRA